MKLLIVEDEKNLNKIIAKRLKIEGYSTDSAFDGIEALECLSITEYDAILLDIMLPHLDGLSVLQRLRSAGNRTPVLFLTAKDTIVDKVTGLDSGADDYLVKPFEFDELLARLRVMLRRDHSSASNILTLGDLHLDLKTHEVTRSACTISLTAKEYEILEYMLQNAGCVLSRQQIQEHVWDFSYEGSSNMIDVYINTLRKKIDKEYDNKLLHTIRGAGYVLKIETEA
jgi:two-component system, OmpR family, copper resistance phosphate regulon response regulator CusR